MKALQDSRGADELDRIFKEEMEGIVKRTV